MKVNIPKLERLRLSHGLTKAALASLAGIGPGTVSHVLQGNNSSPKTIKVIAEALGITAEEAWTD